MNLARRGFIAGLFSTPAVALAIKPRAKTSDWQCSWCGRPSDHAPQPNELYICPACQTHGLVPAPLPFSKEYATDIANHAGRVLGIIRADELLSAADLDFIIRQMHYSRTWNKLIKDLQPVYKIQPKVCPIYFPHGYATCGKCGIALLYVSHFKDGQALAEHGLSDCKNAGKRITVYAPKTYGVLRSSDDNNG